MSPFKPFNSKYFTIIHEFGPNGIYLHQICSCIQGKACEYNVLHLNMDAFELYNTYIYIKYYKETLLRGNTFYFDSVI